jgi:FKBP-type peptidyl-prolyl cis-trans isomerase 2/glutaredoxin
MVKVVEEKNTEHNVIHHPHHPVNFMPTKKRNSTWIFIVLAAVIIAGVLVFFLLINKPATITTQNLKIQYILQLKNGTVLTNGTADISAGTLASTLGIYSKTVDSIVSGMAVGEQKDIPLNAADAFGEYNSTYVVSLNRTSEINRTVEIPLSYVEAALNESPVVDKLYTTTGAPWPNNIKILSIDNSTQLVKLSQEATVGNLIQMGTLLFQNITEITADKIKTRIISTVSPVGQKMETAYGTAKILVFDENTVVFDFNPEYAGNDIILKVKVLDKTTSAVAGSSANNIAGAPTLEVFVMSYCPYGTQMEKALIPAWKLLGSKANIKVRFVSYTMHGDQETQENQRQLCLREETNKFWGYLECFLDAGDSAGCLNKIGADSAKIDTCMKTKADSYWQIDKDLNTKYGVQGSPTVVLDGNVIQPDRSPEAIKQAICEAFANKPSECSQILSATATSPGFGASAGSSSSNGGCASA